MEEWKDIPGYEGKYQVSDLGNVRSLNYRRTGQVRNLALSQHKLGYMMLNLKLEFKKTHYVHRLVAMVFIPNPDSLEEVNHIDGDKTNNQVENLEWCTHFGNMQHAWNNGLLKINHPGNGTDHVNSILTEDQVLDIRSSDKPQIKLAEEFGVSQKTISQIKTRKAWKHI